jgi:23S rRNA pseudouridine955/2504/2580 synthase
MFPYDKISLVHRLDKETSGVLIVAKNQRSAQILSKEFQDKTAQKEYLALLMGNVSPRSGVIDNFMTKGHILEEGENVLPGVKAYRAITEYKVISEIAGTLSWVSFSPKTGRTHQLRIHSAFSLGAPIIGDTLYNKEQRLDDTLNSLLATKNLFLFAYKLSFRHPGSGKIMTIRAELPNFMLPVIKFLEFKIPE